MPSTMYTLFYNVVKAKGSSTLLSKGQLIIDFSYLSTLFITHVQRYFLLMQMLVLSTSPQYICTCVMKSTHQAGFQQFSN